MQGSPVPLPRILIVDDNRDLAQSLAEVLEGEDYTVRVACSGEEAIDLARETEFDVALLDIRLPGIDGVTVLRKLMGLQPALAAMMMTGARVPELVDAALAGGAREVLRKPFGVEYLLDRLHSMAPGEMVLIADDDGDFVAGLGEVLRDAGYRVAEARDGREAVDRVLSLQVDVLLLDLRMPELSGLDVVRALRRRELSPLIILLTAYADSESEQIAALRELQVTRCLAKPFATEILLGEIGAAIADRAGAPG